MERVGGVMVIAVRVAGVTITMVDPEIPP